MRKLALLLLISLAFLPSRGLAQPAVHVATVNGEPITLAELDGALNANLPDIPLTAAQRKQLRSTLLSDMIDDRLVKQFLAKNAPPADPAELEAQIKVFVAQLAKENQTLAGYLRQTGQTESQLRADWAATMQFTAYVQKQTTGEQIKAYFAANRDLFDKTQIRVSHLVVRLSKGALPGELATAREKIQAVQADIAAGRIDFASAARKHSQDTNALKGGDLGFIERRGPELEEPLLKAAFALKKGEVSNILETPSGLHLLLVTDRKPGPEPSLDKCLFEVVEAFTEDFRKSLVVRLRREGQIRITLP